MPKIVKNGKEYSGVPIEVVTAWQPTGDPVQVAEPLMSNTDISNIGDGTITGAISSLSAGLTNLLKIASATVTTNSAGSFSLPIPADGTCIVAIKTTTISGTYYTVAYNNGSYGAFQYSTPHNPYNGSITVKYFYI